MTATLSLSEAKTDRCIRYQVRRIRVLWVLAIALIAFTPLSYAQVDAAGDLTVLSFNVRSARGDQLQPRYEARNLEALVELIGDVSPDAILLQELDRGVRRTERVDQFDYLLERTGLAGRFAHTVDYQGGRFGLAVLTSHELSLYEEVHLPQWGGKEPRKLQRMRITLSNGQVVDLMNTHIDPERISRGRHIQRVAEESARRATGPSVLGGDFNIRPTASVLNHIRARFRDAAGDGAGAEHNTFPARSPLFRVDYLFYRNLELESFTTLDARGISDHRPVIATFSLGYSAP